MTTNINPTIIDHLPGDWRCYNRVLDSMGAVNPADGSWVRLACDGLWHRRDLDGNVYAPGFDAIPEVAA